MAKFENLSDEYIFNPENKIKKLRYIKNKSLNIHKF